MNSVGGVCVKEISRHLSPPGSDYQLWSHLNVEKIEKKVSFKESFVTTATKRVPVLNETRQENLFPHYFCSIKSSGWRIGWSEKLTHWHQHHRDNHPLQHDNFHHDQHDPQHHDHHCRIKSWAQRTIWRPRSLRADGWGSFRIRFHLQYEDDQH